MVRTSDSPRGPRRTAGGNGFSASTLKATTLVLIIVVVIFAVITQLLAASGTISLSTTLQLTMWLVTLGFIIVLVIAYMFFRVFGHVYETATGRQEDSVENTAATRTLLTAPDANGQRGKAYETPDPAAQQRNHAQEGALFGPDAGSPRNPADGPRQFIPGWSPDGSIQKAADAWVPPDGHRHLDGSEYFVSTEDVFPDGCYLEPDSITLVSGESVGQQVYQCRVVDRNPALNDRPHETVVKILANQKPSPGSMPRFGRVEFENLTITPYVTDQNPMRIRYLLRATGLHPAAAPTGREEAAWTVPPSAVPQPRNAPPGETAVGVSTEDAPSEAAGTS